MGKSKSKKKLSKIQSNGKISKQKIKILHSNSAKKEKLFDLNRTSLHEFQSMKSKSQLKKEHIPNALHLHYNIDHVYDKLENITLKNLKYVICKNNQILIVMPSGSTFSFSGLYNLKLLCGNINILGYTITTNKDYAIFSNEMDGIIEITCKKGVNVNHNLGKKDLVKSGVHISVYDQIKDEFKGQMVSIILIRRNSSMLSQIIEKTSFSSHCKNMQKHFSPLVGKFELALKIRPMLRTDDRIVGLIKIPENWIKYADNLENVSKYEELRIVICGGMNTGKTTLVRYLCNRLLSLKNITSVACLDIDPLKPLLSAPGTISMSIICSPILGPASSNYENVTYLSKKEIVFPYHLPSHNVSVYYDIVKSLAKSFKKIKVPIVVNTMSYNDSVQTEIIANLLQIIKPSHVVQLHRDEAVNSFDINLISKQINTLTCISRYKYKKIPAYNLIPKPFHIGKSQLNLYNLLSHMVSIPGCEKIKDCLKCITIDYTDYAFHSMIPNLQQNYHLIACNMNLVALSKVDVTYIDKNKLNYICDNLWKTGARFNGYGLVIKIDTCSKKLTYLTSSKTNCEAVNALLAVGFPIPASFRRILSKEFLDDAHLKNETSKFRNPDKFNGLDCKEYTCMIKSIFNNTMDDLNKALSYLCIWKSRISKVPIGVDVTISLLKAQITLQDTCIEEMHKKILIQNDICKFVNMLSKSFDDNILANDPRISEMSALLNICPMFGEFRNFMIHEHMSIDLDIIKALVLKGMQWLKDNYWEERKAAKTMNFCKRKATIQSSENILIKKQKIETTNENTSVKHIAISNKDKSYRDGEFKSGLLKKSINLFFSMMDCKRPSMSTDINYTYDGFMIQVMEKYVHHPKEVMNLFIDEIFLNHDRKYFSKQQDANCKCKCCIIPNILKNMNKIFEGFTFVGNDVSTHFLKVFLLKSKDDHRKAFNRWFTLFLNNVKGKNLCKVHEYTELELFANSIDWRIITIELMKSMDNWQLLLAKRIIREMGEKIYNSEKMLNLLNLLVNGPKSQTEVDDIIYSVDMIKLS